MQVALFMKRIREEDLVKRPGISESLDWASALLTLERSSLDEKTVVETMGCILKHREDVLHFQSLWAGGEFRSNVLNEIKANVC